MCKVAIVQLTPSTICHVVCDINVFWKPLQLFSHMYGLIIFSIQTLKIVFFTRLQTQKTLCKHIHTHTHTHTHTHLGIFADQVPEVLFMQ